MDQTPGTAARLRPIGWRRAAVRDIIGRAELSRRGGDNVLGTAKRLVLIAAGYALAVAGGFAAVALNEAFMPEEISQGSGGMVAFGDMILFVLVTGFLSIAPTFFLLKLWLEKAPRSLLIAAIAAVAIGPLSWLAMLAMARGATPTNPTGGIGALAGVLLAFVAIPRMVAGPVVLAIEALALFFLRERRVRMLLAAAMVLDVVPLGLFALHMARAVRY
jgi:hypothetical protein